MAQSETPVVEARSKIEDLRELAQNLYDMSEDFPALNRNLKRILASVTMLEINLEDGS